MIALLKGKIVLKSPDELIVDVGGVGYHVSTSLNTLDSLPEQGNEITLFIYTHVREDTLSLYGFLTKEEKTLFLKLIKISGIGPKLALSILSGAGPADFVAAVLNEDLARLNAIPGVGKKTAERIIVDLKDKLVGVNFAPSSDQTRPQDAGSKAVYNDAVSALVNLGYSAVESEHVLAKIGVAKGTPLTKIIKDALKELHTR